MSADLEKGTTPSTDPINPEWNLWIARDEKGKLREIAPADRLRGAQRTKPRAQAAHLQALAARIGVDPDALAERISEDTLRRLKYPMLERVEPDGTRSYEHDVGIVRDGRLVLLKTDHSNEPIVRNAPQPRDSGKFTKK